MRNADDMANVAQAEFQQLVCHDTARIAETEQAMFCEDRVQAHRPSMQQSFVTDVTKRAMPVNNLNFLPDENLS